MMTKLTPFLKWAGGKTWLASKLAEMFEPYRESHTWVEPFCGGLGATLGVMPKKAILSDVNPHLINLYQHIADGMPNLNHWQNTKEEFENVKHRFNHRMGDSFNAQAFYYLNRTCFNGLCRFNQKGKFNVGYAKYKKPKLDHDFSLYQKTFEGWEFHDLDYFESLKLFKQYREWRRDHFIYADPPYDAGFTSYSGAFDWTDQVKLALALASLDCPVVASNKATDRIIDLYKGLGFLIEYVEAPRRISCNGDRKPATEMLATKNI